MKKAIISVLLACAFNAPAEPVRNINGRAIEERAERAAIRAAAVESVAELIRQDKLPAEKIGAVAPLFPVAAHGKPMKTGDVVVVDGKIGVVTAEVAVAASPQEIVDAIEFKGGVKKPVVDKKEDAAEPKGGDKGGK